MYARWWLGMPPHLQPFRNDIYPNQKGLDYRNSKEGIGDKAIFIALVGTHVCSNAGGFGGLRPLKPLAFEHVLFTVSHNKSARAAP